MMDTVVGILIIDNFTDIDHGVVNLMDIANSAIQIEVVDTVDLEIVMGDTHNSIAM